MKVRIDLDACYRSGECYYNHPELVRMGDDGDPQLIATDLNSDELERHAREAAEVCPASAWIIDEST
ncbi:MAG: ferredoxin [Pseudomonadales bacterium]